MTLPVFLRPEAQEDAIAARNWYGERRPGLGQEFLVALDDLLAEIAATPQMHEVVVRDIRRGKMRRFPYVVYYRLLTDRIEVVAILHGRRDPAAWTLRQDPR